MKKGFLTSDAKPISKQDKQAPGGAPMGGAPDGGVPMTETPDGAPGGAPVTGAPGVSPVGC
jgi:hypothetical protein